jgi:hypothetical protein
MQRLLLAAAEKARSKASSASEKLGHKPAEGKPVGESPIGVKNRLILVLKAVTTRPLLRLKGRKPNKDLSY